jgi:hypothetical protein
LDRTGHHCTIDYIQPKCLITEPNADMFANLASEHTPSETLNIQGARAGGRFRQDRKDTPIHGRGPHGLGMDAVLLRIFRESAAPNA